MLNKKTLDNRFIRTLNTNKTFIIRYAECSFTKLKQKLNDN